MRNHSLRWTCTRRLHVGTVDPCFPDPIALLAGVDESSDLAPALDGEADHDVGVGVTALREVRELHSGEATVTR